MEKAGLCAICGMGAMKLFTCGLCGRAVCGKCMFGGACKECVGGRRMK